MQYFEREKQNEQSFRDFLNKRSNSSSLQRVQLTSRSNKKEKIHSFNRKYIEAKMNLDVKVSFEEDQISQNIAKNIKLEQKMFQYSNIESKDGTTMSVSPRSPKNPNNIVEKTKKLNEINTIVKDQNIQILNSQDVSPKDEIGFNCPECQNLKIFGACTFCFERKLVNRNQKKIKQNDRFSWATGRTNSTVLEHLSALNSSPRNSPSEQKQVKFVKMDKQREKLFQFEIVNDMASSQLHKDPNRLQNETVKENIKQAIVVQSKQLDQKNLSQLKFQRDLTPQNEYSNYPPIYYNKFAQPAAQLQEISNNNSTQYRDRMKLRAMSFGGILHSGNRLAENSNIQESLKNFSYQQDSNYFYPTQGMKVNFNETQIINQIQKYLQQNSNQSYHAINSTQIQNTILLNSPPESPNQPDSPSKQAQSMDLFKKISLANQLIIQKENILNNFNNNNNVNINLQNFNKIASNSSRKQQDFEQANPVCYQFPALAPSFLSSFTQLGTIRSDNIIRQTRYNQAFTQRKLKGKPMIFESDKGFKDSQSRSPEEFGQNVGYSEEAKRDQTQHPEEKQSKNKMQFFLQRGETNNLFESEFKRYSELQQLKLDQKESQNNKGSDPLREIQQFNRQSTKNFEMSGWDYYSDEEDGILQFQK